MKRRTIDLATAAMETHWLAEIRSGKSTTQEIATRETLSERRVRFGAARARSLESSSSSVTVVYRPPRLEPLFPIRSWTPQSPCPHYGRMRRGSIFCCMVCHRSGVDGHPALQRTPADMPRNEPLAPVVKVEKPAEETRKVKRARRFSISTICSKEANPL